MSGGRALALGVPIYDGDFADPFMLAVDGTYYAYATSTADQTLPVIVLRDDPTPLRIRSAPGLGGGTVGRAEPDTEFTVVGGPVCLDGYIWWQLRGKDGRLNGWAAEGTTQIYFMGVTSKAQPTQSPPTQGAQPTQPAGSSTALKPGGYYGIVDHTRRHMEPGTRENGRRVDPVLVIKEVQESGFEFVDFSDSLRRPNDLLVLEVGNPEVSDRADGFTLLFRKPE